ncbi:MAG: rane protein, partial [Paenibacillus sp.]|nr:rane protein [Paenibacillus sp.]
MRSVAALAVLFLMTRLLGKKQLSQLNFFHYISGITIGNIAGFISLEIENHFMLGVSAILVWTLIPLGMEWLQMKSVRVRKWFDGEATVLIKDGKVLEDNLKKASFTSDELLEELRHKNAFRVADVEFAVLETDGKVSVLLTKENQPITPKSLGLKVPNEQEPQTVIMDGEIMDEPLSTAGFSRGWLTTELEKIGVTRENVYLAQVDSYGGLTVDLYDDLLKTPQPSQRELL